LLILVLLACVACRAQNLNASVTGAVSDPTRALIPGATVVLTNVATGVAHKTFTNDGGTYQFLGLIPGVYRANVSKEGFKGIVKENIELHVESQLALNFNLELGDKRETVTVTSGQGLVDTGSISLGYIIEGRQVRDTPLNGRNPMTLVALVPGVVPQGLTGGSASSNQSAGGAIFVNPAGYGNYQIGGGIAGANVEKARRIKWTQFLQFQVALGM